MPDSGVLETLSGLDLFSDTTKLEYDGPTTVPLGGGRIVNGEVYKITSLDGTQQFFTIVQDGAIHSDATTGHPVQSLLNSIRNQNAGDSFSSRPVYPSTPNESARETQQMINQIWQQGFDSAQQYANSQGYEIQYNASGNAVKSMGRPDIRKIEYQNISIREKGTYTSSDKIASVLPATSNL